MATPSAPSAVALSDLSETRHFLSLPAQKSTEALVLCEKRQLPHRAPHPLRTPPAPPAAPHPHLDHPRPPPPPSPLIKKHLKVERRPILDRRQTHSPSPGCQAPVGSADCCIRSTSERIKMQSPGPRQAYWIRASAAGAQNRLIDPPRAGVQKRHPGLLPGVSGL